MKKKWFLGIVVLVLLFPVIGAVRVKTYADTQYSQQSLFFKENGTVRISAQEDIICCKEGVGTVIINGNPELSFPLYDNGLQEDDAPDNGIFRGFFILDTNATHTSQQRVQLNNEETALVYIILNTTSTGIVMITADYIPPSTVLLEKPEVKKTVTVQWSAATDNIGVDHYRIYRSLNNFSQENLSTITAFTSDKLSYKDSDVDEGRTYYYGVVAVDAADNAGGVSNVEAAYVPDVTPPEKITSLFAVPRADGEILLSWNPASDNVGVAEYRVYRSLSKITNVRGITPTVVTTNIYKDRATDDGTAYFYAVAAVDFDGNEAQLSNEVSATADATPPDTLTITARPTRAGTITLTWDEAPDINNGGMYYLYKSATPFSSVDGLSPVALKTNKYVDLPATTQYYAVLAEDIAGNKGARSDVVSATPDAIPPLSVTNLRAIDQGNLSVVIQWEPSASSDVAYYTVYRASESSYEIIVNTTAVLLLDTAVEHGKTYFYKVHGVDNAGNENNDTQTVSVDVRDRSVILEVYYPQNNSKVNQDTLILLGKTDPNATVSVVATAGIYNDSYVDSEGNFIAYVLLEDGTNTITLTARDRVGNEKTQTLIAMNDLPNPAEPSNTPRNRVKRPLALTPDEKAQLKREQEQRAKEALAQVKQQQRSILASPRQVTPSIVDALKTIDPTIAAKENDFKNNLLEITAAATSEVPSRTKWGYVTLAMLGAMALGTIGYFYYLKPKGPQPPEKDIDELFDDEMTT